MAFDPEPTRTPTAIGSIEVLIFQADPLNAQEHDSIGYRLKIAFDNGGSVVRAGDLLPHLTGPEKTALQSFMDTLRARAIAAILPTP